LHALVFRPQTGSGAATAPVGVGILALSGMFQMGQDTWPPPAPSIARVLPVSKAPGTYDVQGVGTAVSNIEKHTIEPA